MLLYNKKDTFVVVIGIVFCHVLIIGLCINFAYKFLILSYIPTAYVLLVMMLSMLAVMDIICHKYNAFRRFLILCSFDHEGITCSYLGLKKWKLMWDSICVYGIDGNTSSSKYSLYGVIFFSTDPCEKYGKETCYRISNRRIVFQADIKKWLKIKEYMPEKMQANLEDSIYGKRDCYYRVNPLKVEKRTGDGSLS